MAATLLHRIRIHNAAYAASEPPTAPTAATCMLRWRRSGVDARAYGDSTPASSAEAMVMVMLVDAASVRRTNTKHITRERGMRGLETQIGNLTEHACCGT